MNTGGSHVFPPSTLLRLTQFSFPQVVTTVPFVDTTILGNLSDLNKIEDSKNGGLSNALIISSDWACTLNEAMKSKLKKYFFFIYLVFDFSK